MHGRLTLAAAVVIGALFASATASAQPSTDTLTVSLGSEVDTLDPHIGNNRIAITATYHLFDTLMDRDPRTNQPVPRLAESVRAVNDRVWRVAIRRNARFHDGRPVRAEDVKYSLERLVDPKTKSALRGQFTWLKRITVADPYTVEIGTDEPYPLAREVLTLAYVIPKGHGEDPAALSQRPVGSGPYRLIRWTRGQELVLEAFDGYWAGPPAIKRLRFVPLSETATRISGLLASNIDVVRNVPPDQIRVVNDSGAARMVVVPGVRVDVIVLDAFARGGRGPVQDRRVREALALAINVDEMIESLVPGGAVRLKSVVNPMQFGADPSVPPFPYDPERAKALLRAAGYGGGLELSLYTQGGNTLAVRQVGQAIQAYLSQVGIRVNIRHVEDAGQFNERQRAGRLDGMHVLSAGSYGLFDAQGLFQYALTDQSDVTYIFDKEIQARLREATQTVDEGTRRELFSRIQRRMRDEVYWIPLWAQTIRTAIANRVEMPVSADDILRFYRATIR